MASAPRASSEAIINGTSTPLTGLVPSAKAPADVAVWDRRWGQLRVNPESVTLADHWRLCGIKFRFRNYRELFDCLELLEARTARLDASAPQRRYAPVITSWMRASAFAELGETEVALKWAESAWAALPAAYHDVTGPVFECHDVEVVTACRLFQHDDYAVVAIEAGGARWTAGHWMEAYTLDRYVGKDNPAGLDLRPQAIAMSIAAQRSVLHATRGETDAARSALAELQRWADASPFWGDLKYPFGNKAWSLALGPMFAMHDYPAIVDTYDKLAAAHRKSLPALTYIFSPWMIAVDKVYSLSDSRTFTAALEDASDAFIYATSLARSGAVDRAARAFDSLLATPDVRDMGGIYWAALYERSQIALAKGQRAEATRCLREAVAAIEHVRSTISFEAGKLGFATSKQAVYAALVAILADDGDWDGALRTAERAKARALVDLLAHIHEFAAPPAASNAVRELLAAAAVEDASGLSLDAAAASTRNLSSSARSELLRVAPEAASLLSVPSVDVGGIGVGLAEDESLIDYFASGDVLYAFVVEGGAVRGIKLSAAGLDDEVRAFRAQIERDDSDLQTRSQALYDRLIRPLSSLLRGHKLTISPHGALHYLPFAALTDGDEWLIDRYALRIVPSASALAYLRTEVPNKPGRILALGNPDLEDRRYDLPFAQQEAIAVAKLFPASRALVRGEASKTAFKELASSFAIVHLASHGLFDPDSPLDSALLLAKGGEPDGRLTVGDLYSMRLDVELVTLSACQTGLGKVLSGDDVIGLTRGFLYAGARTIVASLWSVDDAATAQLMIAFYKGLAELGPREALRRAQIQTREARVRPRFWAAFELTGRAE